MPLPVFTLPDDPFHLNYPLAQGLQTSRLALGCMHFGGSGDPKIALSPEDKLRARKAITTSLELGWNLFDHADIYCRGRSESVFGELLREMKVDRQSIYIQSKCGIRFRDEPVKGLPHRFDFSADHIQHSVNGSLQRLGTDYLDVLLLHRPDLLAEPEEVMAAFADLRSAGKVRHFGVSNCPPALLDLFAAAGFTPVANQVEFNPLRTSLLDASVVASGRIPAPGHPADGTLEWHRRSGVVTQAWAPMAYGYLSGRTPDWDPERVLAAAAVVKALSSRYNVPNEAIVMAWILRHPAGIQPIVGTRDPERLRACHAGLSVPLSREDWYALYLAGRGEALP